MDNVGRINDDNNLGNIRKDKAVWEGLLIQADFKQQMFAGTEE